MRIGQSERRSGPYGKMIDMGTYTNFCVAGYPLLIDKSEVSNEVMTVFRESDRRSLQARIGDRNPLVWGAPDPSEADDLEQVTLYACDIDHVVARLEIMGFTLERSRRDFEAGVAAQMEVYQEWAADGDGTEYEAPIALLRSLTFEGYLDGLRRVLSEGLRPYPFKDRDRTDLPPIVRYILDDHEENFYGFFATDVRTLVRAACEVAPRLGEVIQDVSDLIDGGYYLPDQPICQEAIEQLTSPHLENAKCIVLTEGSSDAVALKGALEVLYPHLAEYFAFMDFAGTRAPGGASQLAATVKAFAAAGINNRVIALFDNDSAAQDVLRGLASVQLPPNIAVLKYPDIEALRSCPTLGPSGDATLDVNGLAAGLELYFGLDVLQRPDGTLMPVQWKGYVEALKRYQGEVLNKGDLQATYMRKLGVARADPSSRDAQDWAGMDAILQVVFHAFDSPRP